MHLMECRFDPSLEGCCKLTTLAPWCPPPLQVPVVRWLGWVGSGGGRLPLLRGWWSACAAHGVSHGRVCTMCCGVCRALCRNGGGGCAPPHAWCARPTRGWPAVCVWPHGKGGGVQYALPGSAAVAACVASLSCCVMRQHPAPIFGPDVLIRDHTTTHETAALAEPFHSSRTNSLPNITHPKPTPGVAVSMHAMTFLSLIVPDRAWPDVTDMALDVVACGPVTACACARFVVCMGLHVMHWIYIAGWL